MDEDQLIVMVHDITDSINLQKSVKEQKSEMLRINYAAWELDESMKKLYADID